MKYKWCVEIKRYSYKDKVILANTFNGKWIRLSKELYDVIEEMICKEVSSEEVEFDNIDDKEYFEKLLMLLEDLEIIFGKGKKWKSKNKIVSIELTKRCNLKCIHCCMNAPNNISSIVDFRQFCVFITLIIIYISI